MIIAVTGSSGSIGQELVPFLEKLGHIVVKISNSVTNKDQYIFSYYDYKNGQIKLDVDILIHLASHNSLLTAENYHNEIKLTDDIVNGLNSIRCKRLIFFSTGKVYGDNSFLYQEYDESSALNPSCYYSKAKKGCEELIHQRSNNLEFIDFLLQFDAKCFLDVIQKLFAGQSYQFLDQQVLKNSEPKVVLMSIHKQVLK